MWKITKREGVLVTLTNPDYPRLKITRGPYRTVWWELGHNRSDELEWVKHRTDGPAVVWQDGLKEWYQDGRYHRTDGPAIIRPDGTTEWYQHGMPLGLRHILKSLGSNLAKAAQEVYDAWDQDEDGNDEELGNGGICDGVASAMADVLSDAGLGVFDGGQDGDDHAWLEVCYNAEVYGVDIPASVYETGGGYVWKKRPGVTITKDDIQIFKI